MTRNFACRVTGTPCENPNCTVAYCADEADLMAKRAASAYQEERRRNGRIIRSFVADRSPKNPDTPRALKLLREALSKISN